jgi:hypothetical protein
LHPIQEAKLSILAGLLAGVLILLVLRDTFEAMLLPRRVLRRTQFMTLYFRLAWAGWTVLARRRPAGPRQHGWLSHFGPLAMLGLFAVWVAALIIGFGVLEWSVQPAGSVASLRDELYMSGVTFFTLGYGDIVPHSGAARLVAVLEAGTGLGFIAVVIGYLPVLYQLYARREAHVIQLDARAGSPPTAVTMLCRHAEADGLANLDMLLRQWEIWGAELLESHLTYPMLAYYRSQHDNQSWLAALTAITDCCALILVGATDLPPVQARMTFSMARQVVVELSRSLRITPSRYDGGDRLGEAALARMVAALTDVGLGWEANADSLAVLQALRATYEPLLDGLARHLLVKLPEWVPVAETTDHWGRGHRGLIARRLVEQLADRANPQEPPPDSADSSVGQTVRRRLQK